MNGKFGILSLVAAVALAATSGTALAGPKHGRGDDRGRDRDRGREVNCRPKPPVCRPAPRCDDRPRHGHHHHRGVEARFPRGGFVIVIGGNRRGHCD